MYLDLDIIILVLGPKQCIDGQIHPPMADRLRWWPVEDEVTTNLQRLRRRVPEQISLGLWCVAQESSCLTTCVQFAGFQIYNPRHAVSTKQSYVTHIWFVPMPAFEWCYESLVY
jgi:hypothetical protein